MKAIVYSLFGYGKARQENCFDFASYLRGLLINVRMNRLIYPDWEMILETDEATNEAYKDLFSRIGITVEVNKDAPLCKAMLWRLKPAFQQENGKWKYSHVLCRDLDSPTTYREAQAVAYWISKDKAMHAITDSISHNLPLLGGMIGVRPDYFVERVGYPDWEGMLSMADINYSVKGSDQEFLNQYIYPKVAHPGSDSITQHYCLGMANTFLSDYHNKIEDIPINVPEDLKESNAVCGHIGSAGWYETSMFKFLRKHWDKFDDLLDIEKEYSNIFYWANE